MVSAFNPPPTKLGQGQLVSLRVFVRPVRLSFPVHNSATHGWIFLILVEHPLGGVVVPSRFLKFYLLKC